MANSSEICLIFEGYDDITNTEKMITAIFLSFVIFATIVGNSIALHAFFISPELKKITYYFIATLCISDLMIGIFSTPFWIWITNNYSLYCHVPREFAIFINCLDIFCGTWSITSLAMISIERYICIKYALQYYIIMTKRKVVYMLLIVVANATMTTVLNYIQLGFLHNSITFKVIQGLIIIFLYIFPVLVKLFSYTNIFKEASHQAKEINRFNLGKYNVDTVSITDSTTLIPKAVERSDSTKNFSNKATSSNNSNNSRASWSPLINCKENKMLDMGKQDDTQSIMTIGNEYNENNGDEATRKNRNTKKVDSQNSLITKFQKLVLGKSDCCHGDTDLEFNDHDKNMIAESQGLLEKKKMWHGKNEVETVIKGENDEGKSSFIEHKTYEDNEKSKVIGKKKGTSILQQDDSNYNGKEERQNGQNEYGKIKKKESSDRLRKIKKISIEVHQGEPNGHQQQNQCGSSSPLLTRLRHHGSVKWTPSNSPSHSHTRSSKRKSQEQKFRRFKKELKAAKVVGLIMGTFLLCWTPFVILMAWLLFDKNVKRRPVLIAKNLHYLNSALNPILYVVLNKVYRSAVLKSLQQIKEKLFC